MLLLQQLPTPQLQAVKVFFPINKNRTEILSRLQALGIPQLIFTERNNGIHVFSMAAKHVLNQYLSASNSNNNNNVAVSSEPILISSHYAMKLSQTIVTQLELAGKPTSPAKFLFAYLMRNIKTTQTDKTLEKGDEGKLIEDICRRLKNVIVKSDAELFEVLTREQSQDQSSVSNNNATTNFSCK